MTAYFEAEELAGARRGVQLGHLRFGRFYTLYEADGLAKAFALPIEAFVSVQQPLHSVEMQRGEPWPLPHTSADDRAKITPKERTRGATGTVVVQMLNEAWWKNLLGSPCHPRDERVATAEALHA